jgi:hypothetical protein
LNLICSIIAAFIVMAASLRFAAAVAALLALVLPPISALPTEDSVTSTTSNAVTLPNKAQTYSGALVTGTIVDGVSLTAGSPVPSGFYNPNGPILNANDYTSLPFTWPGTPTAISQSPPPRPTTPPFPSGGPAAQNYKGPAWLPSNSSSLTPSLSQLETNGNSIWGLIDCPPLNGTGSGEACGTMPDTGVTRYYDFVVSYQKIAPDGVVRNGLVINGGFPGPLIEANWGDWYGVQPVFRGSANGPS